MDINEKIKEIVSFTDAKINEWRKQGLTRGEFEQRVIKMLHEARAQAAQDTMKIMGEDNNFTSIIKTGSKGTSINPTQMVRCLGPQDVEGKRIGCGYRNRTLPHYKQGDCSTKAMGFISGNYVNGLHPIEVFFHSMAGREGLIDTSCKTSETGYIQRRFCKLMEDIVIEYDLTVRDSLKNIVQFSYGEDSFDSTWTEWQDVEMYKMSDSDFESKFIWNFENNDFNHFKYLSLDVDERKIEMAFISFEEFRLRKDLKLIEQYCKTKSVLIPFNIKRHLDHLPYDVNHLPYDPHHLPYDVHHLPHDVNHLSHSKGSFNKVDIKTVILDLINFQRKCGNYFQSILKNGILHLQS